MFYCTLQGNSPKGTSVFYNNIWFLIIVIISKIFMDREKIFTDELFTCKLCYTDTCKKLKKLMFHKHILLLFFSNWCRYETLMAMNNNVKHQKQMVIPLLVDIIPEDIPTTLRAINYIDKQSMREAEFIRRICEALAGGFGDSVVQLVVLLGRASACGSHLIKLDIL